MKELLDRFPIGNDLLSLTDQELDSVILEILVVRADGDGLKLPKFLSFDELENVYNVDPSLPAVRVKQINERLAATYQRLLSGNYTMPAPGQPVGVVTVAPSGRSGLAPAKRSLLEWAGADRVTLAIVFTDIIGSTALNIELGDAAMSEVRRRHFAQSMGLLSKHAGREVKTIGDSVMAVFRSVDAALGYVLALQANPGSPELQVRAGVHIGSVEVTLDDVFGAEVALASRVVAAIAGAEIWLSSRAKEDLDRVGTYREVWWKPHEVNLKGIGVAQLWSLTSKHPGTDAASGSACQPTSVSAPEFAGAEYRDGEARFRAASQPIGISKTDEQPIFLPSGPAMWLRIMPAIDPCRTWTPHELETNTFKSRTTDLTPLAFSFVSTRHDLHFVRARDGFGVYFADGRRTITTSIAFAFRAGEIWSIDTGELAACPNVLPEPSMEEVYAVHLHGYALFLQNLGIAPPYRWIAGLDGVHGHRLEIHNRSFPGPPCLQDTIRETGIYDLQQPAAALRPFFDKIFDECGLPRS